MIALDLLKEHSASCVNRQHKWDTFATGVNGRSGACSCWLEAMKYRLQKGASPGLEDFKPSLVSSRQAVLIRPDSATALYDGLVYRITNKDGSGYNRLVPKEGRKLK